MALLSRGRGLLLPSNVDLHTQRCRLPARTFVHAFGQWRSQVLTEIQQQWSLLQHQRNTRTTPLLSPPMLCSRLDCLSFPPLPPEHPVMRAARTSPVTLAWLYIVANTTRLHLCLAKQQSTSMRMPWMACHSVSTALPPAPHLYVPAKNAAPTHPEPLLPRRPLLLPTWPYRPLTPLLSLLLPPTRLILLHG